MNVEENIILPLLLDGKKLRDYRKQKDLINTGEKIDIEFKKSENDLNKDIYETVCSFNNKNGGHLFLGVIDNTREIK